MSYKKIMIAVDGSSCSLLALKEAAKLAENQHAQLQLVHVVEESFPFHNGIGFDYSSLIAFYREEGQKLLEKAKETIKKSSLPIQSKLVELNPFQGRIAEVIVEEAKLLHADLLVIGTHGRRGFSHLFLGSVAENIIRIATIPVLLIREESNKH